MAHPPNSSLHSSSIAVIGMAGRFPGARNVSEFWRNLCAGVESIRPLNDEDLLRAGVDPELLNDPNYVKVAAALDDVDMFDASFFGFSPRDAAILDPQQRHFLECCWEALEDAGWDPQQFPGSVGVYAGSGFNGYLIHNLFPNQKLMKTAGEFLLRQTGNDKDVLATRASYHLNLTGPSMTIQTACSTSLVSIHVACQSLLNHECDMALAGGVTIEIPNQVGYEYREGEILSRDGHCRSFDAQSSGTVFGSGAGVVVLRRLEDALADRDHIQAVILGTAINNDGSRKVGYLAPSVAGQAEVVAEALSVAGVDADSISYVETHGTGTLVGDPIEVSGLTAAFRQSTGRRGYCAIGSVKSNIGHLDAAAGVTGFIKAVLALKHRQIPPSLNFSRPNPLIDFENSPFFVNTALLDWQNGTRPRRAGVTSLGIGGTNAHAVLEEAPQIGTSASSRRFQLLTVSAKTEAALDSATTRLAQFLEEHPDISLADVAFTLHRGRKRFEERRAIVSQTAEEAAALLRRGATSRTPSTKDDSQRPVVFLFSGQGSQYADMGRGLYETEAVFRSQVDTCSEQLRGVLGLDLRTILYPSPDSREEAGRQLSQTGITQPALFVLEYALAKLWESWGIRPEAMLGHSVGEFAAACLAGVMTLEEALSAVATRGRLMQALPAGGAMLAVGLDEPEAIRVLKGTLSLAAVNGPRQCVISGAANALRELENRLTRDGVSCHPLQTSHAFHSVLMHDAIEPFVGAMRQVRLKPPSIPFVSNVTGDWITAEQSTDPAYWGQHLRQPVRFAAGLQKLFQKPSAVFVEIGPGRVLSGLASQHPAKSQEHKVVPSLRTLQDTSPDDRFTLAALGDLWTAGVAVDWTAFHGNERRVSVSLPTYPFERKRFWIDAPEHEPEGRRETSPVSQEANSEFAFYRPAWKKSELRLASSSETQASGPWLIFCDDTGVGSSVEAELARSGQEVVTVTPATAFRRISPRRYELRPGQRSDYNDLLADLLRSGKAPAQVLHLWALGGGEEMDLCFYSLLYWAQSIGDQDFSQPTRLAVASSNLQQIATEAILEPQKAVLAGPCRVIPKEFASISCQWIDLSLPPAHGGAEPSTQQHQEAARALVAELRSDAADVAVAYRQDGRWVQYLQPVAVERSQSNTRIRCNGAYLITGGLGGVGLRLAEHLARTAQAKLILMGRTELPEKSEWQNWLSTHDSGDLVARKIRAIQQLEVLGAEVLAASGDICNREDTKRVIRQGQQRFGAIHGVIHAAGVLDDGLIQLKAKENAGRVLGPKVTGTLVLEAALEGVNPDFFLLCSSISNWLAPVGQVDYVAANAFLDAFALSRSSKSPGRVIAIDWARWRNVGMTAEPKAAALAIQPGTQTPHPFLGRCIVDSPQTALYTTELRFQEQWILSEHAFRGGDGLFPGTGYIEMAQALMLRHCGPGVIQVQNLAFMTPIWVGSDQSKTIQIALKKDGQDHAFQVTSNSGLLDVTGATPVEHVSATVRHLGPAVPESYDLRGALARCNQRELDLEPERTNKKQANFIEFGPRFRCLKRIYFGQDEAVSFAELDERFSSDLDEFHTHPALLDTAATGSAMFTIREYDQTQNLYIPASYKKITLFAPLPRRFYCHIRSKPENTVHKEVASFDITVVDENGRRLVEIEEFVIRRITGTAVLSASQARANQPARFGQPGTSDLKALEPAQALEALDVVLNSGPGLGSLVIVAPAGLKLDEGSTGPKSRLLPSAHEKSRHTSASAPGSATPDQVEQRLLEWLGESLGVPEISVQDDFFDLGGDSLLAVRLFAKIKKTFGVELGLAKLFEARTIGALASLIRDAGSAAAYSCIVPIRAGGAKTPLFMVHGVGGNVLTFAEFAKFIDRDRPVYGIQSQALDRSGKALTTVEEMAAYYVREVRERQPVGPYCVLGYSFGSVVAFEMAQQLHAAGERVALLGVIDFLLKRRLPLRKQALRFLQVAKGDLVATLRGREGLAHLIYRLRAKAVRIVYTLFSAAKRPAPQTIGTAFDINWFAAVNYRPRVYPGRLILFSTSDEGGQFDRELGWGGLASKGIEVHELPGNHFDMFVGHASTLAQIIETTLDSEGRSTDAAVDREQLRH